jgi:CBS domain-containing protein
MQLSQILTHDVETIPPTASIRDAARRMKELDVGALPVCDGSRLLGMITDRDIAVRAVADGREPERTAVTEAMTPEVIFCYEDEDVRQAADLMEQKQIRRLPVMSRDKKLVGIVSLGDLALQGNDRLSGEALQQISQPGGPHSQSHEQQMH